MSRRKIYRSHVPCDKERENSTFNGTCPRQIRTSWSLCIPYICSIHRTGCQDTHRIEAPNIERTRLHEYQIRQTQTLQAVNSEKSALHRFVAFESAAKTSGTKPHGLHHRPSTFTSSPPHQIISLHNPPNPHRAHSSRGDLPLLANSMTNVLRHTRRLFVICFSSPAVCCRV